MGGNKAVRLYLEVQQAFNVHTGVTKEYRRRHLALVLKLVAICCARCQGELSLSLHNDSTKQHMLALSRKLGTSTLNQNVVHLAKNR